MTDLLAANPLLLLFVVAALGFPLGRIGLGGVRLGVAAVLFVGLAFGAVDPRLALPDVVYLLGLVLFVYTVGLASGPQFFASLRRDGLRDNLLALFVLVAAAGVAGLAALGLGLAAARAAGVFAGSLTNTPALASVLETLEGSGAALEAVPVVGYAVGYPLGVVVPILAIALAERMFRTDYAKEAAALRALGGGEELHNATIRLTRADVADRPIVAWLHDGGWHVLAGRWRRPGMVGITTPDTVLHPGDELGLIGDAEHLERAAAALGEPAAAHLEDDRSQLDFRRVFVSSHDVAGRSLEELGLPRRFGALVTRVRRGDVDVLPDARMRLQLGDRVRVVAPRERMPDVTRFFGDSYRALSEVDVVSLGLGVALGLLAGLVPVPLPGGGSFALGVAGGPLVVALLLGTLGRTGPVIWQLPYNANLTLRQLGLVLFLAGVGTRSGFAFASTVATVEGLALFLVGAAVTLSATILALGIGHGLLRIPLSLLSGMLAGIHTQPAVLGFATERSGNDLPTLGYATVFPLATLLKILLAQLLLGALPASGAPL